MQQYIVNLVNNDNCSNSVTTLNQQLDSTINNLVIEAVKHFKTKRFRKNEEDDFDERYFYHQSEIDAFFKLNTNPNVKMRIEYDTQIPNKIFCYVLYR